jgi:hypothetical protein
VSSEASFSLIVWFAGTWTGPSGAKAISQTLEHNQSISHLFMEGKHSFSSNVKSDCRMWDWCRRCNSSCCFSKAQFFTPYLSNHRQVADTVIFLLSLLTDEYKIGFQGMVAFAKSLKKNRTLTTLCLYCNQLKLSEN